MGGLGNGRRGGRSPPLLIGALIACILVLGFNYWVSSSRNLELQTKLYDLESQVRRGAAERGAAEVKKNEFQDELQRQKEQMEHLESLYKRQMEDAQNMCTQEKGTLQKNISSCTKTIQQLKGQVKQLNDDLGKSQKDLQICQNSIKSLNKRLSYDMTHCNAEIVSLKEQCEERVETAKREVQMKMKKLGLSPEKPSPQQKTSVEADKVDDAVFVKVKAPKDLNQTSSLSQIKKNKALELLTNDIVVDEEKASSKEEAASVPPAAVEELNYLPPPPDGAVIADKGETKNAEILKSNLNEDEKIEVMDSHDEAPQTEEGEPDMEDVMIVKKKGQERPTAQKPDEPLEYMAEEEEEGEGLNVEKEQRKPPENIDLEQELADYNGDDENEGEFEADKQAELAQI